MATTARIIHIDGGFAGEIEVDLPADLDPRFDFARSDKDLLQVTMKRISMVEKQLRAELPEHAISIVSHYSILSRVEDDMPLDLVEQTAERS